MSSAPQEFHIEHDHLLRIFDAKYGRGSELGWGPRMRLNFDYFSPDDVYEALVDSLVTPGCDWADIGCGRHLFPHNSELASVLAARCGMLFGVDPDPNIHDNPLVTEAFAGRIEDCTTSRRFDVITLRMVAEHIEDPLRTLAKLAELLKPGGHLVIYTPYKWAPMSIVATIVPFPLHNPLKKMIWNTEARDTFPTQYKLNTRADLLRHTSACGLREVHFQYLDDCRTTTAFRWLNFVELSLAKAARAVGLRHPESCLLGVYRQTIPSAV